MQNEFALNKKNPNTLTPPTSVFIASLPSFGGGVEIGLNETEFVSILQKHGTNL